MGIVGGLVFKAAWSGFSLIFVAVGLYMIHRGRKQRGRSDRIARTETTRIRDLRPGTAEVKGTARPEDDATVGESPITLADSLATYVEVEEYESSSEGGGSWKTIHREQEAAPFLVDDGTGEVRVELPPDGRLNVELIRTVVGGGEKPPGPIRRFVEGEADVDEATRYDLGLLSVGERRRYSEGAIEPGEEVYVLGRVREQSGWDGPDHAIDEPTAAGDFILSDKSEEELVTEGKWGGAVMYVFGGLFAGMGSLFAVSVWLVL